MIQVWRYAIEHDPVLVEEVELMPGEYRADQLDAVRDRYLTEGRQELREQPGKRFVNDMTVAPEALYVIEVV
jgi:hypothetical protein